MEQHVPADRTEILSGPEQKTGWLDAHLHVPNGYPLVSVRYSRRDGSGRYTADWSEEAILPISGYASVLAQAIAAAGESPRRLMVEAVAEASSLGGLAIELQVWADGIGFDQVALQGIAMAVLQERQASGKLGLAGQTTVIARLVAPAEAARELGITLSGPTHPAGELEEEPELPQPGHRGRRPLLATGVLAALAIVVVLFATLRGAPPELFTLTEQVVATQIPAGQTDITTPGRSDEAAQSSAQAVAAPVVPATSVAADAATPISTPVATIAALAPAQAQGAPPTPVAAAPTPVPAEPVAAPPTPVAAAPTPVPAAPTPVPVEPVAAPRKLIDYSAPAALNPDWPNDQSSTAWFGPDGYHLMARRQGQFVAVGLPADPHLRDVLVTATFHKMSGPSGGGYGIILRDQGPGPRDGLNQTGTYLVVEVGDRGEVGMWRRDDDRWIDLLPWTASASVRPLNAENVIAVKVVGDQVTVSVNGSEVATKVDATLQEGGAGVFVGGDNNQAVLTQLTLETIE